MKREILLASVMACAGLLAEEPFPQFGEPRAVTGGAHEHLLASYFAIDAWSPNLRYLLALETDLNGRLPETNDVATIGLIDLKDNNRWIPVAETHCWNFQEAAMGHWISNEEFLFNDVVDGKFATVILNWKTGARRSLPYPTAAVSPDRTKIVSINYARLRLTRPDYGYPGAGQDPQRDVTYPEDDGLWLVDLKTGAAKLIVSIASLKEKMHTIRKPEGLAYYCHVVFSKTGKRIFFLGRTIQDFKTWCETVAFTCDADGSNVRVAQDWYASHFNWLDDETMVLSAGWHRGPMGHGVFTVGKENESRRLAPGVLDWDGHCIWMPGGRFISTDGYWDKNTFRRTWAVMRVADEAVKTVGQFFVPPDYRHDYWRCDLHPHFRTDGGAVVFNSVHEGRRQVYMMDIAYPGRRTTCLSGAGWTLDGEPVTVPHSWNLADAAKGPNGKPLSSGFSVEKTFFAQKVATYARQLPPRPHGKRVFLRCEGASQKATVKVNGREVGRHAGAYTGFAFEITDALVADAPNRLEIVVDNRFDRDIPPVNADFTPFGGLYRDVWLVETDGTCVAPDGNAAGGLRLTTDAKSGAVTAEIALDGHEKWSPEEPNLYELEVTVRKGGRSDTVTRTFGFRDAEFREDGFYLNGVRRQLRGVNRHQDVGPEHGWCATAADDARDVKLMKEMGCDAVRLCHYPQGSRFLDLCDREGLLVWSEIPLVNTMTDTDAFRTNTLAVAREMVDERRHHPSVFAWGLYNEMSSVAGSTPAAQAAAWLKPVAAAMKAADPTRPVTAASCEWLGAVPINGITDVLGFNLYPHWYDRKRTMGELVDAAVAKCPQQTIAVSEYGAGGSVRHHTLPVRPNDPGAKFHSEEYQTEILVKDGRDLFGNPKVWGTFLWCMFDFPSCCRDEGDAPGTNDKGVVTRDRQVKKDGYYFYQANWTTTPVLRLVGARATEVASETVDVTGISNVGAAELVVNGVSQGVREPDAVKTMVWKDVRFAEGENRVELTSGDRTSSAVWTRKTAR